VINMGFPLVALGIAAAGTILGTVNTIRTIKAQKEAAQFNEKYNYNVALEKRYNDRRKAFENWRVNVGKRGVSFNSASNFTIVDEAAKQAERENQRMYNRYILNRRNISASASAAISGAVLKGVTQLGAIAYGGYRYSADAKLAQNASLNTGMGYSGATFESLGGVTPYMGSSVFGTSTTSFQPLGGA
tara:strand:- start:10189 stop:10752 length:564 start_codon:yes stop_codon:yes gene_type:complete